MGKTRIFILVAFVAAAIFSVGFLVFNLQEAAVAQERANVAAAEEEARVRQEAEAKQAAIEKTASEATGVLTERVEADEEVLTSVAKLFSNWANYDEYSANREALINDWGVPEDSTVLTRFMPFIEATPDPQSNNELVNVVDLNGWHSEFVSIEPYVVGQDSDSYEYFCIVTLSTSDANGSTAEGTCGMSCSVSTSGKISDLEVITLAD